jgi:AraC-like DNA-binding protein
MSKEMGRPHKKIDAQELEKLMQYNPTLKDAADFFCVSDSTLAKFIQDTWSQTYTEFRDQRFVRTKVSLIQTAISRANKNSNTMLIFALKNLCGWADKVEARIQDDRPFVLSYNTIELKKATE